MAVDRIFRIDTIEQLAQVRLGRVISVLLDMIERAGDVEALSQRLTREGGSLNRPTRCQGT